MSPNDVSYNVENPITLDDVQVYVNRKYIKINTYIKEISKKIKDYQAYIKDVMLEIDFVSAQYFCDGKFEKAKNRIYEMAQNTLKITDEDGVILSLSEFHNFNPYHVMIFEGDYIYELHFKKTNFLARYLNQKLKLVLFEKRGLQGELYASIDFSSNGNVEKYSSYDNSKKQIEVYFDSDSFNLQFRQNAKLIPKTYVKYDTKYENKCEVFEFLYSIPDCYKEYDNRTGKIIRTIKMQGLKSLVYKYSCHDPKNGNLISSIKA